MKLYKNNKKRNITLRLTLYVFLIMLLTQLIVSGSMILVYNIIPQSRLFSVEYYNFIVIFASSILIGTLFARLFSKSAVNQLDTIINAMEQIISENFAYRLDDETVRELGEIGVKFNTMAEELSSLETMKSSFISNFSHEFKTPIVSIRGFAKILLEQDLSPEEQREYLQIIYTEADRLASMTQNTLLLTRLENQHYVYEKTQFSLDEQLRKCVLIYEDQWTEKGLAPDISLAEITVTANYDQLQQMWLNLIGNAIKFSREGGTLGVNCALENGKAIVRISDTGIGIAEDKLPRIFDKFYQCDDSHSTSGNGLGLAICKKLADLNGYELTVTSVVDEGTTFCVTIPAKDVISAKADRD